jgi:hypothetical protein
MVVYEDRYGAFTASFLVTNDGTNRGDVRAGRPSNNISVNLRQSSEIKNWRGLAVNLSGDIVLPRGAGSVTEVQVLLDGTPSDQQWRIRPRSDTELSIWLEESRAGPTIARLENAQALEVRMFDGRGRSLGTRRFDVSRFRCVAPTIAQQGGVC